MFKNRR